MAHPISSGSAKRKVNPYMCWGDTLPRTAVLPRPNGIAEASARASDSICAAVLTIVLASPPEPDVRKCTSDSGRMSNVFGMRFSDGMPSEGVGICQTLMPSETISVSVNRICADFAQVRFPGAVFGSRRALPPLRQTASNAHANSAASSNHNAAERMLFCVNFNDRVCTVRIKSARVHNGSRAIGMPSEGWMSNIRVIYSKWQNGGCRAG